MRKNLVMIFLLTVILFVSCGESPKSVVSLRPEKPVAGEKIKVLFTPRRLIGENVKNVKMIAQISGPNGSENQFFDMEKKGESWITVLETNNSDCLISLKFEDSQGRTEDNAQRGWNFVLYDAMGKPRKSGYLLMGKVFLGEIHPIRRVDFERAREAFKRELEFHPENLTAKFELWRSELALSGNAERIKNKIERELDSLRLVVKDKKALSILEFDTSFRLLNDLSETIIAGRKVSSSMNHSEDAERIRYTMCFVEGGGARKAILDNLEKFAKKTTSKKYKKIALRRLADEYQKSHEIDKAREFYQKYLSVEPEDVTVLLTLASLNPGSGSLQESQALIEKAKKANNEQRFLRENPWIKPSEREAEINFNLCHILSTQAELDYLQGNYTEAIRHRKESIENGSLFPAYEWEKIGDIYREIGLQDSALVSFCRAIAINKRQESAIAKVHNLYKASGGNEKLFADFLNNKVEEQLKSMARRAPDCELYELNGPTAKLSDFKGKIVLVSFWDIWSDASKQQIPHLNNLKKHFAGNSQVQFLAISIEAPLTVQRYIEENHFYFRLFHSGYNAKKQFGVIGFPSHFVIDRQGKIRYKHIGFSKELERNLREEINSLLKETENVT